MSSVPWVEHYRPNKLKDIILESYNKEILNNIIKTGYFPNLLLYGPPGTGKTTSIINLIEEYQKIHYGTASLELVTHLNASDDRGIDVIRNQIIVFAKSKPLFKKGLKFVILDEVDYMTKNAQLALKYLIENNEYYVRFCLMCNYISKIDDGLKNSFLKLRYNQLPKERVIKYLEMILKKENLSIKKLNLNYIQELYSSDLRSMVNYIQSNYQVINQEDIKILNAKLYGDIVSNIKKGKLIENSTYLLEICIEYNIDLKCLIDNFLNYLIRNCDFKDLNKFLNDIQYILHNNISPIKSYLNLVNNIFIQNIT
jgi:replication factor C subunit 3/5